MRPLPMTPLPGGGSIPLEAQRLGLEAHASDLNPVAVLINKALIEIPPKFKDQPPVNPEDRQQIRTWQGAQGLAADVRYYGKWMRDEAFKRIGHLYPKVEQDGSYRHATEAEIEDPKAKVEELTVIAWIWARTVKCPNPACGCEMPLIRSFKLSTKKGKEAWVEPIIETPELQETESLEIEENKASTTTRIPKIRFDVKTGEGKVPDSPKTGRGANFNCLACGQPTGDKHIKSEGMAGNMCTQLMAIIAEGEKGRVYLPPTVEHETIAENAEPQWYPDGKIGDDRRSMFTPLYGLTHFHHLFSSRQLTALTTFVDLIPETQKKATQDAISLKLELPDINEKLNDGGETGKAYGDAVATYLGLLLGRIADFGTTISTWNTVEVSVRNTFSRQAIPMSWDYAEANPLGKTGGGHLEGAIERVASALAFLNPNGRPGKCEQKDAPSIAVSSKFLISTDPPYYDNIGYADLSDFFYIWLRHSLQSIYPDIFSTLLVPKSLELVATPYRFGGSKKKAQDFFEKGLGQAFNRIYAMSGSSYPVAIYYAFKQAEVIQKGSSDETVASTGWETMLEGLIKADLSIGGTWPVRTEFSSRSIASGTNALASSIVLVCRPRPI
jgi:putative DNA methylase